MTGKNQSVYLRRIIMICLLIGLNSVHAQERPYAGEVTAFKKQDSLQSFPPHAILFAGSSSFRLWKDIRESFPGYTVINRGFNGSALTDMIYYAGDIIYPYKPRQIVIYCGENDLASSDTVTALMVIDRFRQLFRMLRKQLPGVPVIYVSIKPSPSRRKLLPKVASANKGIRRFLKTQKQAIYVDVFHQMINKKGEINGSLFLDDSLHMNEKGYAIWQKAIQPHLSKD